MYKWIFSILAVLAVSTFSLVHAEDTAAPAEPDRVAELQSQLMRALNRIDDLEKRVKTLEAALVAPPKPNARPADDKAANAPAAADLAPLDSQWSGSLKDIGQSGSRKATASITSRDGDLFSLRTEIETGEIWVWSLAIDGNKIRVIEMNRIRARQGNANPPGTAGITGSGSFKDGVLSFGFTWPQGTNTYRGEFSLRKQ